MRLKARKSSTSRAGFLLFAKHDVEDHAVRFLHAPGAEGAEVADRLLDVVFDDAVGRRDAGASKGQHGRLDGARDAARDLHRAAYLGPVADHAGDVAGHVLDGVADLLVAAALEIDDAAGGAGRGHDAAAEGG